MTSTVQLPAAGLLMKTFSTVSTGGFSPYNDSLGHFSPVVQVCQIARIAWM